MHPNVFYEPLGTSWSLNRGSILIRSHFIGKNAMWSILVDFRPLTWPQRSPVDPGPYFRVPTARSRVALHARFFREALAQPGAERRGGSFCPPPPNWRWVYQAPNWRGLNQVVIRSPEYSVFHITLMTFRSVVGRLPSMLIPKACSLVKFTQKLNIVSLVTSETAHLDLGWLIDLELIAPNKVSCGHCSLQVPV